MTHQARFGLLICAAILSLAAPAASATPQLRNGTGLWSHPDESGWGFNLFHQGDTLFGALFVYGTDGTARWYVASSLLGGDDGPLHDRPTAYTGALYEGTGPWFGGAFDPAKVTLRQVGSMKVVLGDDVTAIDYSVDGVTVSKLVRPFTFRGTDLSGKYVGYLYQPATTVGPEIRDRLQMTLQDGGSSLQIAESSDSLGGCSDTGARAQSGLIATASGTYASCGSRGSGPFSMAVDMTPDGFTGFFAGNGITPSPWGRIALSRLNAGLHEGNGWRTDLWLAPGESGWGVTIVEQGDTIFATLFVYDAQGRSHWYVASTLARTAAADGHYVFSGPLLESTGPYFGAPFNPATVTRRQVGTMTFDVRDRSSAVLSYTADGVAVMKNVSRLAFRRNSLTGNYLGHLAATDDDPGGAASEAMSIAIDDGESGFVMRTLPEGATHSRSGANCTYTAPPAAQYGEQRLVSGTYACASGDSGPFTMQNAFVTFNGFNATFQGAWVAKGHMEGVRLVTVPSKFSFVSDNAVSAPNAVGFVAIQRTGGISGGIEVHYTLQGIGCRDSGTGGSVSFGDGDASSKTVAVPMGPSGVCVVNLIPPVSPGEFVNPVGASVTVVPVVAGCAVPSNVVTNTVTGLGHPLLEMQASGQTLFMPLQLPSPGRSSGRVTFSESAGAATPQPVTLEISIGKCPGIIDSAAGNFCNLRTDNGTFNSITFVTQATSTINSGNVAQLGYCWAGDGGQYYVNARWTYPSCPFGASLCGFAIQYNDGPF